MLTPSFKHKLSVCKTPPSTSTSPSSCFFNQPSWLTSAARSSQFVYANGAQLLTARLQAFLEIFCSRCWEICRKHCAAVVRNVHFENAHDLRQMRQSWILNDLQKWVEFDRSITQLAASNPTYCNSKLSPIHSIAVHWKPLQLLFWAQPSLMSDFLLCSTARYSSFSECTTTYVRRKL